MAQPPAYNRAKDFTENFGSETDHSALNAEFDDASNSINDIRANLAILQADDGKLRPYVVTRESISDAVYDTIINRLSGVDVSEELIRQARSYAESAHASADIASQKAQDCDVVAGISQEVKAVAKNSENINIVGENIVSVNTDSMYIDEIIAVASDLNAQHVSAFDCGLVTEAVTGMAVPQQGYIKAVYDMRDNIQSIVDNLDSILAAVASIQEIESVNYEQVAEEA